MSKQFLSMLAVACAVLGAHAFRGADAASPALSITHGVASGDVTATTAVIWARASGPARMYVEVDTDPIFSKSKKVKKKEYADATAGTDFTAQLTLTDLEPNTTHYYRVWLTAANAELKHAGDGIGGESGTFTTAPAIHESRPRISFTVGADVAGQNFCRNAATGGYTIFASMQALRPDFFMANGDMVYQDAECKADGPDGPGGWQNIPGDFKSIADPTVDWTNVTDVWNTFVAHWQYNRADPYSQAFFKAVPMIAQWDDHEVINDFGAAWSYWNSANVNRAGYPNITDAGLRTFLAYSPMNRDAVEPKRIYRSIRYGQDLEIFLLDARSYRDRNDLPDTVANNKQMLGRDQIDWLVSGLQRSNATWKVVSSAVPVSIPTGSVQFGRDSWANLDAEPSGFERELLGMLARFDAIDVKNLVFIATDIHFPTSMAYTIDADGDGDQLRFHEFVNGPLNGVRNPVRAPDPAANPTVLYAEGGLFNFGYVEVATQADGKVHFVADVRDAQGVRRPGSLVDLTPEN
jgi:alkaline phosphatase D